MEEQLLSPFVVFSARVAGKWSAAEEALSASGIGVRRADEVDAPSGGLVFVTDAESDPVPGRGVGEGDVRVIVLAARGDVAGAVRAMRRGAHDIIETPPDPDLLVRAVRSALEAAPAGTHHPGARGGLDELIGTSAPMQAVRSTLEAVAPVDANVLLAGESGTGKELAARALHGRSTRHARPFIAVNCAALPREILENELFGHEKGAFTGALRRKPGCFELASGGSLFLDEIGEMSADMQAKLLRVIEQQSYRRLGGKSEIVVDVRIIAATNRDVLAALEDRSLRSDLYYRLSVVEIRLPPLREREEDILLLARHFLSLFAHRYRRVFEGISAPAAGALRAYPWPGNVRELRNTIERAVLLSQGPVLDLPGLPERIRGTRSAEAQIVIPVGSSMEEAERRLIMETLASVGNNKAKAARVLGLSRKTLHNKLNVFRRQTEREGSA